MNRVNRGGLRIGLLLVVPLLLPAAGLAYPQYNGSPACDDCHSGFVGRGPLHDLHLNMTGTCKLCHTSTGDNPRLNSSGVVDGQGCRGCHGVDNGTTNNWGAGLRAHHANAGAPADADGLFCADCHSDPAPSTEDTLPVYYSRTDVDVNDPCTVASASGGEDWNGDGSGLDNDGDLLYDALFDPDCGATPVDATSWGRVKALYH